jgi:hypothetical protein
MNCEVFGTSGLYVLQAISMFGALLIAAAITEPFAFLKPTATITSADLTKLDAGEPIARVVSSVRREVTMAAAVKVSIDANQLIAWYREIEALKKSAFVAQIGRFSDPPRIEDLDRLTLDEGDLQDIRQCKPGECDLKLSDAEISALQAAISAQSPSQDAAAVEQAFRRILLQRVQTHLHEGTRVATAPPKFLTENWPDLTDHLFHRSSGPGPLIEPLIYWSKERLGRGKPVISVTSLAIVRGHGTPLPDPIVIGRQLLATHYVDASWSVTTMTRGDDGSNYLVYVNQSEVDLLSGFFSGMVRAGIQRQLRGQAGGTLRALKVRLESGYPPARAAQSGR